MSATICFMLLLMNNWELKYNFCKREEKKMDQVSLKGLGLQNPERKIRGLIRKVH